MSINIKATNIELTKAIEYHVNKQLEKIEKLLSNKDAVLKIEVGRTTNHHNKGDVYRAEIDISSGEEKYYASSEHSDLYKAFNLTREQILKELRRSRGRKQTLFLRGATSVKKRIKGILSYKR